MRISTLVRHGSGTTLVRLIGQTIVAGWYMKGILPYQGWSFVEFDEIVNQPLWDTVVQVWPYALQTSILILFGILFCWVSAGFWTALMGFLELLTGRDKYKISGSSAGNEPIAPEARTALVMPICNEDVPRVFAGLRATFESVAASGNLDDFCRRWGGDYKYMVVLDADSVMSGECLSSLVRLMAVSYTHLTLPTICSV